MHDISEGTGIQDDKILDVLVAQYIYLIPETQEKNFVALWKQPVAHTKNNICLDLKGAITAFLLYATSISEPETVWDYLRVLVMSLLFLLNITEYKLVPLEARIIYLLHCENAYEHSIEETELTNRVLSEYQKTLPVNTQAIDITKTITNLNQLGIIDIREGYITLIQKVWGTYNGER